MYKFFYPILFFFILNNAFAQPIPGAYNTKAYFQIIKGKNVALVVNPSSTIAHTHLADTLAKSKICNIVRIFAPEHGFRGNADAGTHIGDSIDAKTGTKIISLYGNNKKPTQAQMQNVDYVIFDIQDVGVRFYTYISTLHYVMMACAEASVPLIVLDRPNPHGAYVAGPVLDTAFRSFVGMHPIPIVYGLTMGELASMINGEHWLGQGLTCKVQVIKCIDYTHNSTYSLPIKPSPNLPNDLSVALYPSLCLFEGTVMSVGRGTLFPFQTIGYPNTVMGTFTFTPQSIQGMAQKPLYEQQTCYGIDLRNNDLKYEFTLKYVIDFYNKFPDKGAYFKPFFNKLIGNDRVMPMIREGYSAAEIEKKWIPELENYKMLRAKYLLYK
ncbi:MAG: DUF1343 domain-containing protein [Cytophagales bacterium]|nr:DUF1343 domain-containing protein [Cytophagales bacterium]